MLIEIPLLFLRTEAAAVWNVLLHSFMVSVVIDEHLEMSAGGQEVLNLTRWVDLFHNTRFSPKSETKQKQAKNRSSRPRKG